MRFSKVMTKSPFALPLSIVFLAVSSLLVTGQEEPRPRVVPPPSPADKIEVLERKVSDLTSELSATQAKLREVSKIVMTDRLELTAHVVNGRVDLVGKGLNGEELGGKGLDGDQLEEKIKSISEDYPKPKITIADSDKLSEQDRKLIQNSCARAGIFRINTIPRNSNK